MSDPKFTPGPWRTIERHKGIEIFADKWGVIASCYSGSPDVANARLIAAAPDLYTECRIVLETLYAMRRNTDLSWNDEIEEAVTTRINALEIALAKADGK